MRFLSFISTIVADQYIVVVGASPTRIHDAEIGESSRPPCAADDHDHLLLSCLKIPLELDEDEQVEDEEGPVPPPFRF